MNEHALRRYATQLRTDLRTCWDDSTSSGGGTDGHPHGQCAVTALIIQQELGGGLVSNTLYKQSHWYNLVDGYYIDITGDQFPDIPPIQVSSSPLYLTSTRDRELIEINMETFGRYRELHKRLRGIYE